MDTVKIEKDIYVRDQYGVKVRMFVAGQEVERFRYDEAFRLNVPVNPEDLPVIPEFRGTEYLNGEILEENKVLFVDAEPEEDEVGGEEEVVEDEALAEAEAELEQADEEPKNKKKGKGK